MIRSRWGQTRWILFMLALGLGAALPTLLWAFEASDIRIFKKANEDYQEGRFQAAAETYEELAARYPNTAVFFYNLGNARFRLGASGASLLAYERALALSPRNGDIRRNLNYVRGLLEYKIEDKRNWYLKALEAVLKFFTFNEILFVSLLLFGLFLSGWLWALSSRRGAPWGPTRKTLLILSLIFSALLSAKKMQMDVWRDAVVVAKQAEIRYGPSDTDQVAFRLGEGLKVYVVDRREDWSRALLWNGESGWVKNNQIAEVELPR